MIEFLKKLFKYKDRELTVVLLDDEEPESSNTFQINPARLFGLFYISIALTVVIILFLVIFTPLGSLVYDKEDEELRSSVIEVSRRVEDLRDSLAVRDQQLLEIQQILAEGKDTLFQTRTEYLEQVPQNQQADLLELEDDSRVQNIDMISKNEIIFSGILKQTPDFPAPFPVEGTLTRGFNQETGHLGIDIATKDEKVFRSIADGSVINRDWTISFGYVLQIQHSGGIISVYKHASDLSKDIGDIVLKGDILGTVGNTGVFSSGPHLHLEIWKNGVAQNPKMYLIKS